MNFLLRLTAVAVVLVVPPFALAQSTAGPSGHWEGAIQVPNSELGILIDLAKNEKGEWTGAIDIPAQRMICAAAIVVTNASSCTVWPNQVQINPDAAT